MECFELNEDRTIEKIAKIAKLYVTGAGASSERAFINDAGAHFKIEYNYEYENGYGWDMIEIRIGTHTCTKDEALKVLELRPDLAEIIASSNAK